MRQRNKEVTKEKILQAAAEVFAEENFFKASVDQVCKKAGVSKGIIFWYFKSKDQLILEVAKKSLPLDIVESCLEEKENTLECIGNKYLEKYDDPVMKKLFLHTISAMNIYKELGDDIRELCDSLVKKISKRALNSESNEDIIRIRSFMGGLLCYVVNPPNIDKKTYVNTLIKIVLAKET
ncbi:MAG: TetR/AcrR family transcriptional regulator [Stygiolobus sp.]|nr:TetR/AcrR family transcriptional regulator [Stygiolobus sp.]